MKVEYIARKVNLTDSVRNITEKKLAKVEKYFTDIIDLRLELSQERHLFVADFFVKGKDFSIKSTSSSKELTTAIQEAVDKLEMQARRAKTRLKGRKRHGAEDKAEVRVGRTRFSIRFGGHRKPANRRDINDSDQADDHRRSRTAARRDRTSCFSYFEMPAQTG